MTDNSLLRINATTWINPRFIAYVQDNYQPSQSEGGGTPCLRMYLAIGEIQGSVNPMQSQTFFTPAVPVFDLRGNERQAALRTLQQGVGTGLVTSLLGSPAERTGGTQTEHAGGGSNPPARTASRSRSHKAKAAA